MTFKQNIHNSFLQLLSEKIESLKKILSELKESATNETKRTAGDKHETALAMLQIEQENINRQLSDLLQKKAILDTIDPTLVSLSITKGSLIKTNRGYFYLSVALGKIKINGHIIMSFSAESPLGRQLSGLQVNDEAEINNNRFIIQSLE